MRGQDVGKAVLMIAMVGVSVATSLALWAGVDWSCLRDLFVAAQ